MRWLAKVSGGIFIFVVIFFGYLGITTQPAELDSIGYHIPIAQSVINGQVLKPNYISPYSYYPGFGETTLAALMFLKIPANMFNVIGLILLCLVIKSLGLRVGLDKYEAIILGVSMSLLPTVIRLPMTQLVDIWLAVFWGWWLYLAEKPAKDWKWQICFGLASGFLVGTKISGIMILGVGILFYGKKIRGLGWLLVSVIVGGFWYLRNWIVMRNPFYPLDFWIWKGSAVAKLPIVWKFLLFEKGWGLFLEALVSEFLGWSGSLLVIFKYRNKWIWMGIINFGLFLLMPGSPGTIVSNCRYLIPAIMTLALGIWIEAKKYKWNESLAVVAVINAVMVLPQLEYKPKVILGGLLAVMIYEFLIMRKWLKQ